MPRTQLQPTQQASSAPPPLFTAHALAKEAKCNVRRVHRYAALGVIPRASGSGTASHYDARARLALLAAVKLSARGWGTAAIRDRVAHASDDALREVAGLAAPKRPEPPVASPSAPAPQADPATWLRLPLAPGIELHVNLSLASAPLAALDGKSLAAAVTAALKAR